LTERPNGVIDAHHHLWDPRLRNYPWMDGLPQLDRVFESSDLFAASDGLGVDGTIVVQASPTTEETEWLLGLAEASELILGVVGWVDLCDPAVGDRLAECAGRPLVGIRHQAQDETDPRWLTRPDVARGLQAVHDAGMPFDLLVREPQRSAALTAVQSLPELTFVVDHLGKPDIAAGEWDSWHAWMSRMASQDNVVCKISGLVTEASWPTWREEHIENYIAAALDLFGPERCMFGSDWPVSLLAASYAAVLDLANAATAGLSLDQKHSVFAGTAASVYSLPVTS
jgi:L-fuconolactonase